MNEITFSCIKSKYGRSAAPLPSVEFLENYYKSKYYQAPSGQYSKSYDNEELSYFDDRARVTLDFAGAAGVSSGRLLDLGCGEGFFLGCAHRLGFDVWGVDASAHGLLHHNPQFFERGRFAEGEVSTRCFPELRFDIVFCKNVLEHVIDPDSVTALIADYLTPNGIAIIEVPNDFSPLHSELFGTRPDAEAPFFCPPEHLHYFNTKTLCDMIKRTGMATIDSFGDYPIDHLLLEPAFNYYENRSLGGRAHILRRKVFRQFMNMDAEARRNLLRGFYAAGLGRDISVVFKK
jgi:2-polyprenyl-3-methyl-5-hydroxy-6-metoxy-1,4-benzoquinol methylase